MANHTNIYVLFEVYIENTINELISSEYEDLLDNFTNYRNRVDNREYIDEEYDLKDFKSDFEDGLYEIYTDYIFERVVNGTGWHTYSFYRDTDDDDLNEITAPELVSYLQHLNTLIVDSGDEELYSPLLRASSISQYWDNFCYLYLKLVAFDRYKELSDKLLYKYYYRGLIYDYDEIENKINCSICNDDKGGYTGCSRMNCSVIVCKECFEKLKENKCPYCQIEPMRCNGITKAIIENTDDIYMRMYNNVVTEFKNRNLEEDEDEDEDEDIKLLRDIMNGKFETEPRLPDGTEVERDGVIYVVWGSGLMEKGLYYNGK